MIKTIDMRSGRNNELFDRLTGRNRLEQPEVMKTVGDIVADVRARGDAAVAEYTLKFDKVQLGSDSVKVSEEEYEKALNSVDSELLGVIRRSKANIESFHTKQKENSWFSNENDGAILGQLIRPLEVVGIYVPGGTAVLTSSVLMSAVPAKVAGVKKIVMATPPGKDGGINPAVLVAAREAGVDEVYKIGGAQAIAALAFGTESVPRVDKIFGPGNIYVSTAKRLVFGFCDIDMFAGPSEIMVVADKTADPKFVAADLLSQAEHDILSAAILVTDSETLAAAVEKEIERQTGYLSRKEILKRSLADYSAIILVNDIDEAIDMVNKVAPEHLELCIDEPFSRLGEVKNAGAIFLGHYSSEPLGDYFAGPNHVLPTGGTARFFSPLSTADFVKKSSVISYTRKALEKAKDDIMLFAKSEGLDGHANAIGVRFEQQ
jgi:histidinol dehydrogenase